MKNKQGDIPITILVIGIFAVCMLAILSFIHASVGLRNSFIGIDVVENTNNQIEFKDFQNEDFNYFYQERNKTHASFDYIGRGFKDEILFSVDYERP